VRRWLPVHRPIERDKIMAVDILELYSETFAKVEQLDEVIDAASDSKGAGKRAVVNQMVKDNEENWKDLVDKISSGLEEDEEGNSVPEQVKFGVYYGVVRELRNRLEDLASAYAESRVEARPETEKASAEEVSKANEERSKLVGVLKNLKGVLDATQPEIGATLKVPRKRPTGGARGKRAISFYNWTNNGEAFEGGITELAKALGYERPATLRDEMKAANINLTKPPVVINFTTPAGNVLVGTRAADAPDFDSTEVAQTEDDDEDENEDETEAVSV